MTARSRTSSACQADEGVTLVVVDAQARGDPPGRAPLQVLQGLPAAAPADLAQRQVVLPPAQRPPRPLVQVRDRERRAAHRPGRRGRRQRDGRQARGRADDGKCSGTDGGGIEPGQAKHAQNVGRGLVEQSDEQVSRVRAVLAQAAREVPGRALGLHLQVALPVVEGADGDRGDIAQWRASASELARGPQRLGGRPVSHGDADEQVKRAAPAAGLVGEQETMADRVQIRAGCLIGCHGHHRRRVSRDAEVPRRIEAAIAALDAGRLPGSAGEKRMLRLAASLADQATVSLGEAITGIDDRNVALFVNAVRRASGRR